MTRPTIAQRSIDGSSLLYLSCDSLISCIYVWANWQQKGVGLVKNHLRKEQRGMPGRLGTSKEYHIPASLSRKLQAHSVEPFKKGIKREGTGLFKV